MSLVIMEQSFKLNFDLFSRMSTKNPLKETSEGFFVLSGFVGQQEEFFFVECILCFLSMVKCNVYLFRMY